MVRARHIAQNDRKIDGGVACRYVTQREGGRRRDLRRDKAWCRASEAPTTPATHTVGVVGTHLVGTRCERSEDGVDELVVRAQIVLTPDLAQAQQGKRTSGLALRL